MGHNQSTHGCILFVMDEMSSMWIEDTRVLLDCNQCKITHELTVKNINEDKKILWVYQRNIKTFNLHPFALLIGKVVHSCAEV